jgi:nitrate/nitrite transporter NarK
MNGLCAALGKFGALLGASLFPMLVSSQGYPAVFAVCAVVSFLGYLVTLFFVIDAREPADQCHIDFQKQTPNAIAHYEKHGDYRHRLGPTFP